MSRESALLTKVLTTGNFRVLLAQKITRFSFEELVNQEVYSYISKHFSSPATKGQVPSPEAVKEVFPTFQMEDSPAGLETLCTELREIQLRKRLEQTLIDVQALAEVHPQKALDKLRRSIFSMAKDLEISELGSLTDLDDVKEAYYRAKDSEGIVGIPFPWDGITKASGGLLPQELVVWFGRNKSMKSWLLMFIAAHVFMSGYKVLFVSAELAMLMVKRRLSAIIAGVDYEKFRLGLLSEKEEQDVMMIFDTVLAPESWMDEEDADLVIMALEGQSLNEIDQKISEIHPDLVCIDSVYMLADPGWKEQTALIRKTKSMAKEHNIPIIVTTQANRSKDKTDRTTSLAFSDAYAQIADYLLHVEKTLTHHPKQHLNQPMKPTLFVEVVAAREFQMEGFRLDVLPAIYCRESEVYYTAKEFLDAKDAALHEVEDTAAAKPLVDENWTASQ